MRQTYIKGSEIYMGEIPKCFTLIPGFGENQDILKVKEWTPTKKATQKDNVV